MQLVHCPFQLPGNRQGHHLERLIHRLLDALPLVRRGPVKHIVDHLVPMTGMADADAQPQEIVATQMRDQIAQTVVAAVATALFETRRTRRQIQLIMDDQNLATRNPEESGQRCHRPATAVHERRGFLQAAVVALELAAADIGMELCLVVQATAMVVGKPVNKPEPGVMPGLCIFRPGVAQTDDEPDGHHRCRRRTNSRDQSSLVPAPLAGFSA